MIFLVLAPLGALIEWVFESFPEIDAVWTEPNEGNLAATTLYYSCGMRSRPRPADLPHPGPSYWERARTSPAGERGGGQAPRRSSS